jgi:plastocyanin
MQKRIASFSRSALLTLSTLSISFVIFTTTSSTDVFAVHSAPGSYLIDIVPGAAEDNTPFHYHPPLISIPSNTVVTWFNADPGQLHTATSGQPNSTDAGSLFNSGGMPFQWFYSYKFDAPGNYTYFCQVHPEGFGVISVNGQIMRGTNFEFSTGTGALSWNLAETDRNLMRFEPFTTSLAPTDSGTYRVIISGSDNRTVFSETLTSGNNVNLEVVATGGNRTLYGPDSGPIGPGPLGEQLIVNGAFHVQGDVRPDDYIIRIELTSINGRPVDPITDEFGFRVTR